MNLVERVAYAAGYLTQLAQEKIRKSPCPFNPLTACWFYVVAPPDEKWMHYGKRVSTIYEVPKNANIIEYIPNDTQIGKHYPGFNRNVHGLTIDIHVCDPSEETAKVGHSIGEYASVTVPVKQVPVE